MMPYGVSSGELVPFQNNQVIIPAPTATQLPKELIENRSQTRGIIVGGILLVAIVIVGTLSGIQRR